MDEVASFGIVMLAALVQAAMQLGLGTLLLLYHASLGKHIKKNTRSLVSSYISGVGILVFALLCGACYLINLATGEEGLGRAAVIVSVGVLVAMTVAVWFFYYRRSKGTELWLPKTVAKTIDKRAKDTENDSEAFALGMLTCVAELPFTFILFIMAADAVIDLPATYQPLAVVLYTLVVVLPFIMLRLVIRSGKTVVDIQKWRVKNKLFLKIITGLGFLVLGLFILAFKLLTEVV